MFSGFQIKDSDRLLDVLIKLVENALAISDCLWLSTKLEISLSLPDVQDTVKELFL